MSVRRTVETAQEQAIERTSARQLSRQLLAFSLGSLLIVLQRVFLEWFHFSVLCIGFELH